MRQAGRIRSRWTADRQERNHQRRGFVRLAGVVTATAAALLATLVQTGAAQARSAETSPVQASPARQASAPAAGSALPSAPAATTRCTAANLRWAASSNSLYVNGQVACTLAEIKKAQPKALLEQVQPGVWLLGANLRMQNGARLEVHGPEHGGDVRELRLASGPNGFVYVRADWGELDFRGIKLTSWDRTANRPDTNPEDGRAFVHVRSRLDQDGKTPRESRMDVIDSDVGHLGHYAAEAYGLSWKVCCAPDPALFEAVNVHGDVTGSHLHHLYFGAYTYGGHGMRFENNQVDHNVMYGLDPHDDSDHLVIRNNHVHSNGNHGIICSQRCNNLVIEGNRSENNQGNGIMLHRNVTATAVRGNQTSGNADSGIAIFDSHGNTITDNKVTGNKRGVRLSVGSSGNEFRGNQVSGNREYGVYFYQGTDKPTKGDGRPTGNTFIDNVISGSGSYALNLQDADKNLFEGNRLSDNAKGLRLTTGKDNRISQLRAPAGVLIETAGSASVRGRTLLDDVGAVKVKGNANSETVLTDSKGQVFTLGEGMATTTTRRGSKVVVNGRQTGTGLPVASRALWAIPHYGQAKVTPTTWTTQGTTRLTWTVHADSANQPINWTVGDVQPGRAYTITRDGKAVTTVKAGDTLRFTDRPGKRHQPVTYAVTPA